MNADMSTPRSDGTDRATPTKATRASVLLIEDHDESRSVLRDSLEVNGFDVQQASDGPSGLRLLETLDPSPDIIVVDWLMPGMSGLEMLAARESRGATIPAIVITGAVGFLPESGHIALMKPFEIEELLAAIASVIPPKPPAPASG